MPPLTTPAMIRGFGRRGEGTGLVSIWMGEHVALIDKNTHGYPGSRDGRVAECWMRRRRLGFSPG